MGVFDTIKNAVGSAAGHLSAAAVPEVINQVYPGGLPGLLSQLQRTGYGQKVDSWLGHGPNDPITGADLQKVLGDQHVRAIEQKLGIPGDQVLNAVAKALPEAVDQQSPNGKLETPAPSTPSA